MQVCLSRGACWAVGGSLRERLLRGGRLPRIPEMAGLETLGNYVMQKYFLVRWEDPLASSWVCLWCSSLGGKLAGTILCGRGLQGR